MGRRRPQAPRHGRGRRLRPRAEDRRLGRVAGLRGRRARPGSDARRRRARGGRDRQPAHHRGDPAPDARRGAAVSGSRCGARSTSRSRASCASTRRSWPPGRSPRPMRGTRRQARCDSSIRASPRSARSRSSSTGSACSRASSSPRSGRRSNGCEQPVSARTRTRERLDSIEDVADACIAWEERRAGLGYEIDGIVIKLDSFDQQRRLGSLHGRPRFARAFKWAPTSAVTRLTAIHVRVGRTGVLNPLAELEPVHVGGVTVYERDAPQRRRHPAKDIRVGDLVIVQRAGDVIPQVVGPAGRARAGDEAVADAEALSALPHGDRAAPGRSHAPLPEPGVPVAGPGDALPLGRRQRSTSRTSAEARSRSSGTKESSARSPTSTGSPPSSSPSSKASPRSRRRGLRVDPALEGAAVLARPLRAEHPEGRVGDRPQPRAALPHGGGARGGHARAARGGRGHRARAGGALSPNGSPIPTTSRSLPSCASSGCSSRSPRTTARPRDSADGYAVRHHGNARGLDARGGEGGTGGLGREGIRLRLEEDDRRRRGGEPGLEGAEGGEARRAGALRGRLPRAARSELEPSRSDPGRRGPSSTGPGRPLWTIANTYRLPTSPRGEPRPCSSSRSSRGRDRAWAGSRGGSATCPRCQPRRASATKTWPIVGSVDSGAEDVRERASRWTRSKRERPEPSATRTPPSGSPHRRASRARPALPRRVEPAPRPRRRAA